MVPLIGRQLIGRTQHTPHARSFRGLRPNYLDDLRDGRVARDKICLPESLGRQPNGTISPLVVCHFLAESARPSESFSFCGAHCEKRFSKS